MPEKIFELTSIKKELCDFIQKNIISDDIEFNENSILKEIGVDSYSIVEILLFIERKFGIILPENLLNKDNLISAEAMSKCVYNFYLNTKEKK